MIASQDGVADSLDVTVVAAEAGGWAAVDAEGSGSTAFSCATRVDGEGYCWGNNFSGQLGPGIGAASPPTSLSPVEVTLPGAAIALDVGTSHACVVLQDGSALCWGEGGSGELGNGALAGAAHSCSIGPRRADSVLGRRRIRSDR